MRKRGVELDEIDYAKRPLDEATVKQLVAKAGSVAAVLNTRHATAKAKGWADQPPDAATFAKAVAAEPNLLRRPILVTGARAIASPGSAGARSTPAGSAQVIVGFDEAAYRKL